MNTLGLVMRQINANMQMSLRSTDESRERVLEQKRYEKKAPKPKETKAKHVLELTTEEAPKSEWQLRYEEKVRQREEEKRRKEEEEKQKRIKKAHDAVYGSLFNLDIQDQETIKSLAKEIVEYLNWSYNSGNAFADIISSLKVNVEDIDYGKRRYFENVSFKLTHTKRPLRRDESPLRIEVELKKSEEQTYKIYVFWRKNHNDYEWFGVGKMKGKFVEHVTDWAIDLLVELAKLEQQGEIEKKEKENARNWCFGWS